MNYFKLLSLLILISSCSLAPFAPTTTGRSYGKGKFFTSVGNANSTYHLKYGLGVSDDVDFGFTMEFGEISTSVIFLKYAAINNEEGPALGFEFGFGSTDTTEIMYGGATGSLKFSKQFELFMNARVNSVDTAQEDIEKDEFHGNVKILSHELTYLQFTYGVNLFFSDTAGVSLYSTYYKGDDIETLEDSNFGASFIFNF